MYKAVPGNHSFQISLSKQIISTDGSGRIPEIVNNLVRIPMYGKERVVDLDWLAALAWYEVDFPPRMSEKIFDIYFVTVEDKRFKYPNGQKMLFRDPIYFRKGFRVIPEFCRYAVNKDGVLVDMKTGRVIHVTYVKSPKTYPFVSIKSPFNKLQTTNSIHRLLALAWINNKDPIDRRYVNHIDGDKKNFHLSNLEWCSFSENINHAVENGLRTDNTKVKVRDVQTGEITEFPSIRRTLEFLGIPPGRLQSFFDTRKINKPFNGRYEVRTEDDKRPWFFEVGEDTKAGVYRTTVKYEDGTTKVFNNVIEFIRFHKLWNISNNIHLLTKTLKERRPGVEVEIVSFKEDRPIEVLCRQTGKVVEVKGYRNLTKLTGIGKSRARNILYKGPEVIADGYSIRRKSDEPWPEGHEVGGRPECVLAYNRETREEFTFQSLREAQRHTGITRKCIDRYARLGQPFRSWVFKYTD